MFGRKRPETEDRKMSDDVDDLGIPMKPARPPGQPAPPAAAKAPSPVPPRTIDLPRPAEPARPPGQQPARPTELAAGQQRRNETDVRKLIVGREISLSGEINSCDRLVVEG